MPFDPPIAGQTPLGDISGLRDQSIKTTSQLNAAEAENIRKAVLKYLASKPTKRSAKFDVPWTKKLHKEMLANVWAWAGAFRTAELNIGSQPYEIEAHMHALLEDLHQWSNFDVPMIEQAARLHHGAVKIHPFLNGNGRWARLLTNIWLKLNDQHPILWPEQTIGSTSTIRAQYITALQAADHGDYTAFIKLHQDHQSSLLHSRTKQLVVQCFKNEDQPEALKMLEAFNPHWPNHRYRCEIAAIKYSEGSIEKLVMAIDQGECDLRDLLMWVDFGHDTNAHLSWIPDSGS